jgi:hypothetical protein
LNSSDITGHFLGLVQAPILKVAGLNLLS